MILKMASSSKILLFVSLFLIVLSVAASYYRFMILQDYIVSTEVDCDPTFESCFTWICDPEEEECPGDEEEDTWYFKIAFRNAKNIPDCDSTKDEDCLQFDCPLGSEEGCNEILCTTETMLEYGYENDCTDPINFIQPDEAKTYERVYEMEYSDATPTMGETETEDGGDVIEDVLNAE